MKHEKIFKISVFDIKVRHFVQAEMIKTPYLNLYIFLHRTGRTEYSISGNYTDFQNFKVAASAFSNRGDQGKSIEKNLEILFFQKHFFYVKTMLKII